MFVRAKIVKGNKYAYLVKNIWKKGKVKQETKKYLGKIIDLDDQKPEIQINKQIDFSNSIKEIMFSLIVQELELKGFIFDNKHSLKKENIIIKLTKKPYFILDGKNVVLLLNKRYVYPKLFELLLDFFEPESEDDKKGKKLAFRLKDAGIHISQEHFIQLYKKIYLE